MTELPELLPHGPLEEVLADVFVVRGQVRPSFGGHDLQMSRTMTVVRDGGSLTLINTMRLDDDGLASLDELGTLDRIVKLGSFHGRDDAFYVRRNGAEVWSLPGMPHERGVVTDVEMEHGAPGPCEGSEAFVYETSQVAEGLLLLARHGGILVSCDSIQTWTGRDEWFDEATAQLMESRGFFGHANFGPGWLGAGKPERSDFDRLKELSFRHLISAHGAPLLNDAHAALLATIEEKTPTR